MQTKENEKAAPVSGTKLLAEEAARYFRYMCKQQTNLLSLHYQI
ncbi:hypothetical protein ACR79P_07295 [Sphingobacterium spiritivorum]|uniref:Uncharacterized protein n=1 Tax=Sphingobacterium spiritivorum ATCC 33861 TaxID=525373 RepID=D7VS99_SPHSI|nr:hypothetical protein HMPREF0766_13853 [Sphingobacterium spiritivorum ATCC 33861]